MSDARPSPTVDVAAVCRRDDALLLVREGHGPAGGEWRLPGGAVRWGETLAESIVGSVGELCGLEVLCGPFLGWREHLDDERHRVRMYFEGVAMGPATPRADGSAPLEPAGEPAAGQMAEFEWVDLALVLDRRLEPGLAEFLGVAGLVEAVV